MGPDIEFSQSENQEDNSSKSKAPEDISDISVPGTNTTSTGITVKESKDKGDSEINSKLESMVSNQDTSIKVVGCGGGGNNTINRIDEVGIEGVETIAVNTDAQDLLYTTADKKILIGQETTEGLGAGSDPSLGAEAAREQEHEIKESLKGADMVFVTCGLGGGTGTGSIPIVTDIANKIGALTVGIVTLPFEMEGAERRENAQVGLERLEQVANTLIVIPNEKLLEMCPDLPIHTAFKVADEILTNAVRGIAELITRAGLVNLDFADIESIMSNGGVALIGMGESDTENRASEAIRKALENPLLDVNIEGGDGALINVSGGEDMTLDEASEVVDTISENLDDEARIIWGSQIYEDLEDTLKVMLVITGVESEQILGPMETMQDQEKEEMENELGINFLDR